MDRRTVIRGLLAGLTLPKLADSAVQTATTDTVTTTTLETFADTLIPGAKRFAGDRAVAGVSGPPGGADSGFLELLRHPLVQLGPVLPELAGALNVAAAAYAASRLILLPWDVPPLVGMTYPQRAGFLPTLFRPTQPDRLLWILLALLASASFDTAAQRHTSEALRNGHPGLKFEGFPLPNADGVWRFADFSYGRPLAVPHPRTTVGGSPS